MENTTLFPDYKPPRKKQRSYEVRECEIVYKPGFKFDELPVVTSSKDSYELLKRVWDEDGNIEHVESFKLILLNRANKVIGVCHISQGGVAGTVADPKIIFQHAIKGNATGIIISHNHPSGNLNPSQADIDFTKKVKEGGKLLEIKMLDHIIMTPEKYYSFADEGLL